MSLCKQHSLLEVIITAKLLSISLIGSADAERGFSIMNHIRTSRRSRLSVSHLNCTLIRLQINEKKALRHFPAIKYARALVEANHCRSDDPDQNVKKISLKGEYARKRRDLFQSTLF